MSDDAARREPPLILLIAGSLRDGSVNAAVLRTAAALAPDTVRTEVYGGLAELPPFSPSDDAEGAVPHPAVAALRAQLGRADAILFCTPEYAGSLPGSFKNLLDWSVGGGETYGLPVAWINASGPAAPTGGAGAHAALRSVLTYTGTVIVESACRRIPVTREEIGPDGLVSDADARAGIAAALTALAAATGVDPPADTGAAAVVAPRAVTRSAVLAAEPDPVLAVLADARRIPEWAPAFADAVQAPSAGEPGEATVTKDGERFTIRVRVTADAGTVDYLREIAPGRVGGAYLRVVPAPGGGSVVTMTVPAGADPDGAAATVQRELAALDALTGGDAAAPAPATGGVLSV